MLRATLTDKLRKILIFAVIAAPIVIVSHITGISICIIYNITGMPCPSCGMTRAWLFFFNLDFQNAFFYHPLFLTAPFIFAALLLPKKLRNIFFAVIAVLFIGLWIIRLVALFPDQPPMDYNYSALVPSVYRFITGLF